MANIKISDSSGKEVSVTSNNALKVDPSGTTQTVILTTGNDIIGQVKITDGTDVADILDLTNSNPLAVAIMDSNGSQISSFGGGTEYTEDAASAANPVGGMIMAVRADSLAAVTTTDGDNIALRATNNGELYIKHVDSIPVTDNGGSLTIDATSLPLPTGAATAANQSTIIGHVDGIESLLTTIDSDTSNISTKIDTIAGAVSGTEMQVDVLTMPTVTVSATNLDIRDLSHSQDSVRIGDGTDLANVTAAGELNVLSTAQPGVDIGDVTINNASGGSAVNIQDGGNSITIDNTNLDTPLSTLDATLNTLLKPADTLAAITSITNVVHVDDNSSSLTIDDGGSSITVDGSISVSGSVDTELPSAAALADNTANPTAPAVGAFGMIWDGANWDRTPGNQTDGVLVNLGANNDVTVTSSALPSGAATSANQTTIIGHVDGIESLLTTIDADTSNISTKIDTLAGAVSGTEMQVDVLTLPALPTGTNTIGSVKLTDGTDTAAITAAGELSVLATAQPGTDIGDVTINNASGGSAVNIQDGGNSITVDNGGTFVVQENGAALTSLQLIDDTVYTDNAGFTDNSSKILGVGYVFDETAGTALTENDIAAARIDSKRAIVNVLEDGTTRGLRQGVVDETGTNAVDAAAVGGGTPHDSVDSGNPIKIGGKAVAHGSNPSAVAAGDRSNAYTNVHGIPFAIGGHPNIQSAEYYTTAAQTDDNILPAISTGTIYVITCITVTASAANTVNTSVRIGFGTANVPTQGSSGADGVAKMILSHPGIAPGSGIVKGTGSGIVGIGGDGEELRITNSAPTTGSLIVQVDYFTISV